MPSDAELAVQSENPVTRMATLPLRYDAGFNDQPTGETKSTLELNQAIVPFRLDDDWSLITRTKMPFLWQPPKKDGRPWTDGVSNGYTTLFLSPSHGTGFYWAAGPVIYYPAFAGSTTGVNKWGSGPSAAVAWADGGPWVFAVVANNIWSFGGPPESADSTNSLLVNPIVSVHFGNGWFVHSSPNITSNWLAASGKRWTVPVGGGAGKVFRIGGQPMKLSIDAYDNAIRPAGGGPVWTAMFAVTWLFPR